MRAINEHKKQIDKLPVSSQPFLNFFKILGGNQGSLTSAVQPYKVVNEGDSVCDELTSIENVSQSEV